MPTYAYRCEECGEELRAHREHLRARDGQAGLSEVRQRQDRERAHRVRGGDRKKS